MPERNNLEREKKLSHLKNLVFVAAADGHIDKSEQLFLSQVAQKFGISAEEFNAIMAEPGKIQFTPPATEPEKIEQLRELIVMMLADGSIDKREVGICLDVAMAMGLPPEMVAAMTKQVIADVQKQQKIREILANTAELKARRQPNAQFRPTAATTRPTPASSRWRHRRTWTSVPAN